MPMPVFSSSISTNLPSIPSASDPELQTELVTVYNAIQALHQEMTRWGRVQCNFTEAATAGQELTFFASAGILNARLANATDNTRQAVGFAGATVGINTTGEVILIGVNNFLSGLTPGTLYYLSTTNGTLSSVAPVGVGKIKQPVGFALSTTNLLHIHNPNFIQL